MVAVCKYLKPHESSYHWVFVQPLSSEDIKPEQGFLVIPLGFLLVTIEY